MSSRTVHLGFHYFESTYLVGHVGGGYVKGLCLHSHDTVLSVWSNVTETHIELS